MSANRFLMPLILLSLVACVLAFQNCTGPFHSPIEFLGSDKSGSSSFSSGNGDTYDGKPEPGTYYRVIPDQRCGGERVIHSFIDVSSSSIKLSALDPATCARHEEILPSALLDGSNFNRSLLAYAGGTYERREVSPDLASRALMTPEVWCRSGAGPDGLRLDVLVRVAPATDQVEAKIFDASSSPRTFTPRRSLDASGLTYFSTEFSLNVDLANAGQTGKSSARLRATIDNKSVDTNLTCALAGRLDPQNTVAPLACPTGYIMVPTLASYTQNPFCISKYEPSGNGALPASVSGQLPWVNISRDEAIAACQALGPSYDLITNNEWQSTARNIESVPENWSGAVVGGAGGLSRGHSDNNPSQTIASSANDDDACTGTGQTCSSSLWNSQRRTLRLTNGAVVWDLAGNADEWVKDDVTQTFGPFAPISQINSPGYDPMTRVLFGPAMDYSSFATAPFAGLGEAYVDFAGGALRRGGGWEWNGRDYGGLFNTYLYDPPSARGPSITFRCSYHP